MTLSCEHSDHEGDDEKPAAVAQFVRTLDIGAGVLAALICCGPCVLNYAQHWLDLPTEERFIYEVVPL